MLQICVTSMEDVCVLRRRVFCLLVAGHVLHEMCTGKELKTPVPTDYNSFPKDVAAILKFIFGDEDVDVQKVCWYNLDINFCIVV